MDPSCSASGAPASLTVQVCFPGARAAVMDNLNRQREEGRLCDLSIQVQGQVFRAHRCVLAASSPYFHDQVLLKDVTTVSLPSVMDPVAFESVLSSAYTGQLSIVHEDIVNYVTVASFLQMWHIVDKCTEILKRPRPPAEAPPGEAAAAHAGPASRQQSPSSTDCLYVETEGRKKDRKPDALPPLATWRRPQQLSKWGRSRPPSAQHSADSQLDSLPGYADGDYAGCEEAWVSGHARGSHCAHDGPGHSTRSPVGFPYGETVKQKVRAPQRGGPPPAADRLLDKSRESAYSDESQERRKNARKNPEADEGVGEDRVERREGLAPPGNCGVVQTAGKDREPRDVSRDPPPDPPGAQSCQTGQGVPGPPCPVASRLQWQDSPWSQQEAEGKVQEDGGEVDFECFTGGTFGRDTYDEIEEDTGQVSQRPLAPASPDFTMAGSEVSWPPSGGGQGSSLTPASAPFPPPSSPSTPSSSSSVSLAGAPYTGKVHFCHCGKAYTLKSMRDRHVKMQHLNLRPFGCPVCTKSFKMKHHLTKHLKTHGGLRPYECSLCGKKVVWRDSFLRHQARCERLASSSSASCGNTSTPAAGLDHGYGYGFEDGEAFLATEGQVKVEEVDFPGEMEDGMGGLVSSVGGMGGQLRSQAHVLKEEAKDSFSGS
ncbi:zinc finger and BTB domain-containing protein 22 [Brachionichthys hirsutus]|uniref:zinc finger and BTB domain-containing protein 22 n=1 Tax=Brachionichthys hirsutus TaxID=412623 RepID=UPI003604E8EF